MRCVCTARLAFAISTASAATRSISSSSREALEAKPQFPSTSARTENPLLSASLSPATTPFLTSTCSSRVVPKRTSAYCAPLAVAVSSARCAWFSKSKGYLYIEDGECRRLPNGGRVSGAQAAGPPATKEYIGVQARERRG